ncbi:MAG TPA: N-acetylmuramoyl-L-alanine amidase [Acidobacteriaceae bacterium]|jgi:N-acetylmuramoyl-L-alanine amidase|nr:N-acetylmuramoyl-L-alanine amidase [Acidobacteriaceae bacterium]
MLFPAPFALASQARAASFAHAERLREALEGRPEHERSRAQYERVLDAYRAIYHGDPASPRADDSIAAVANLLAEEGRVFQDDKALHDAIGQYDFLRRQYPASRLRYSALLTEGEIFQRDLNETAQAKATYKAFLSLYPRNALAAEARTELRAIEHQERSSHSRHAAEREVSRASYPDTVPVPQREASSRGASAASPEAGDSAAFDERDLPPASRAAASVSDDLPMNAPPPPRRGKIPLITGIRHWSTPDYTRVAIDLQQEVRYQAARVSDPDRIFFDLYGTRLSPELTGRPVEVTDDGFLTRIRAAQTAHNTTRVVLDVTSVSDYSAFFLSNPPRLIIDVHGGRERTAAARAMASREPPAAPAPSRTAVTTPSRVAAPAGFDSGENASALTEVASLSHRPDQVRATQRPTTAPVVASVPDTTELPSRAGRKPSPDVPIGDDVPPDEAGARGVPAPGPPVNRVPSSMVRTLGLKINRIVIDAGHGGHDSGTLGPGGLEEKDVVLDVALRLGRLLKDRLGADVIYTRSDDTFIPLETRTAIANQAQADLFISIHANSSPDTDARGVEVYYLNFTTSADALEVAARENASSDESIHQLSDLVKKIALQDKINESRTFAEDVDESLYTGLERGNPGLKDRGVKKAPFVVLIGANMPSILAEISFLTNPDDAAELRQPRYRERIAESLYRGVDRYVSSLNGVRMAQAGGRSSPSD